MAALSTHCKRQPSKNKCPFPCLGLYHYSGPKFAFLFGDITPWSLSLSAPGSFAFCLTVEDSLNPLLPTILFNMANPSPFNYFSTMKISMLLPKQFQSLCILHNISSLWLHFADRLLVVDFFLCTILISSFSMCIVLLLLKFFLGTLCITIVHFGILHVRPCTLHNFSNCICRGKGVLLFENGLVRISPSILSPNVHCSLEYRIFCCSEKFGWDSNLFIEICSDFRASTCTRVVAYQYRNL